jgi:hypothetical protein
MSHLQRMREKMDKATLTTVTPLNEEKLSNTSYPKVPEKIVHLSKLINTWHKTLPLPNRWQPLQLGRIATRFNVSRELAATALQYGGWIERRIGNISYWEQKSY